MGGTGQIGEEKKKKKDRDTIRFVRTAEEKETCRCQPCGQGFYSYLARQCTCRKGNRGRGWGKIGLAGPDG